MPPRQPRERVVESPSLIRHMSSTTVRGHESHRILLQNARRGALAAASLTVPAAGQNPTNAPSGDALLTGALGRLVKVPTNEVPPGLLPPADLGLSSQIPQPARGTKIPEAVLQRQHEKRAGQATFQFFPSAQPRLMPYLAAQDEFGNTAIRPDPLIRSTPLDWLAQQGKYRLSGGRPALFAAANIHPRQHVRRDAGRPHAGFLHLRPGREVGGFQHGRFQHRGLDQRAD